MDTFITDTLLFQNRVSSFFKNLSQWFFYWTHWTWIIGMICLFSDSQWRSTTFEIYFTITLLGSVMGASVCCILSKTPRKARR